jgi:general stress protein 26
MTPQTELDARYSDEGATATDWETARQQLAEAPLFWVTTVRADGRPHTTPLIALLDGDALYFCTGPGEQKARNLEQNQHCSLMTGANTYDEGLDIIVEGEAVRVTDTGRLQELADRYESKYGSEWHFDVVDDRFRHDAGTALVFEVAPATAYGFSKGEGSFSHTRWRFGSQE